MTYQKLITALLILLFILSAHGKVNTDRAAIEAVKPQITALEAKAQPWVARADRYKARVDESLPNWRIEMRNRAFAFVASIFQSIADVYLNRADELRAEMQALRDGADAKDQQAAALDNEAAQLLTNAEQARQAAQALRAEAAEEIAKAEQAEAKAAEYRRLAANPPETKETTIYTYGPNGELLGEYDEQGKAIKEYVYLDGKPVAILEGDKTHYVHNDHLGTPKKLTDETQKVVWEAEPEPFGKTTANEDPDGDGNKVINNLRFPGQYFDEETGLHYNWNRYYDPFTDRYTQADHIGLQGGNNLYLYANANSINYYDPNGEAAQAAGALCFIPGVGWVSCAAAATVATGATLLCMLTGVCEDMAEAFIQWCLSDDKEEQCDRQYYDVDIPTCRGIARKRGIEAAQRCYASAAERYAACLAGKPMPPLDTLNN